MSAGIMKIVVTVIIFVLLSACTEKIRINVIEKGTGNPVFILSPEHADANLDALAVIEIGENPSEDKTVWRIYALPPSIRVSRIEYGVVPEEFVVDVPNQILAEGRKYRVIASAYGHIGQVAFIYSGN